MKKHILLLLTILCTFSAFGQNRTLYAWARPTDTAYTSGSWRLDSVMRALYYATSDTNKVLGVNAQGYFEMRTKSNAATVDSNLYATVTRLADTSAVLRSLIGTGGLDTTSLSDRINARVKYTDTAAMLLPYATDANLADTAAVLRGLIPAATDTTSLSNRIDARVKYTDTAAMLSPYLRSALAASTYVPYSGATSNVNLGTYNLLADAVQYNLTPSVTPTDGLTYWDAADGTLAVTLSTANGVTLQLGQENHIRAVNKTGVTITDGQVVYISGAQGNRPTITLAQADSVFTSTVIGVATQSIANNAEGYVTTTGVVNGFNTTGFTAGDELFLSASTAGVLTNTAPTSPNNTVPVAIALNSTVNGAIYVHPQYPLSADTNMLMNSDRIAPTQKAVKSYADKRLLITDTANIRIRPIAGANMTITGTYPNITFASSGGGGSADSVTFATNYRLDTTRTNIYAQLETKVKYTDTATMLTPYLRKGDTTAMLLPYLRDADTASLSNRINLKANIASPTFTGTVTIPTGANITTPNILGLTSGSTNDSIVVADPTTGALKRISSSRIGGGSAGWSLTGNSGLSAATNFLGTTDNIPLRFRVNGARAGDVYGDPIYHTYFGFQAGNGANGTWNTGIGTNALTGASVISVGNVAIGFNAIGGADNTYSTFIGGLLSNTNLTSSYQIVIGGKGGLPNATQGGLNLGNVIWGESADGGATSGTTAKGRVSIGTNNPNDRALLELSNAGTTKGGFKLPEFTTTDRDAISWVAGDAGMMIWNTTTTKAQVWTGATWVDLH